jgi:hypothetical protein
VSLSGVSFHRRLTADPWKPVRRAARIAGGVLLILTGLAGWGYLFLYAYVLGFIPRG